MAGSRSSGNTTTRPRAATDSASTPKVACGFYLSDGGAYRPERALPGAVLAHRQWQHVVGTWDGTTKSLWLNGKLVAQEAFAGPVQAGTAPLWLGACGHDGPAVNILDGDLAMPVIYDRALSAEEIAARYRDQGLTPATGDGVLACWPLAEERGESVADCSGHGRDGRIVNSANLDDRRTEFRREPGAALRRLRSGARSAARPWAAVRLRRPVRLPLAGHPRVRDPEDGEARSVRRPVPLHARRPAAVVPRDIRRATRADAPAAPILVIAATNTWLAYRATPFAITPPTLHCFWDCGGHHQQRGRSARLLHVPRPSSGLAGL